MKQFTPLQLQLITSLSNGTCQSGNDIAKKLGVSRTAIWKHVSQLAQAGLDIKRNARQGYQLTQPFIPLTEASIRNYLVDFNMDQALNFHLFAEIDSTNRFLRDLPNNLEVNICCAESQTQGRGRFGRQWHSPFGKNIYFSGRWQLNCCLSQLSGLSLAVSLAILDCLHHNNIYYDIRLKWPNDLLWEHRKLAGVLIEILAETNGHMQLVIGIGLNVNANAATTSDLPAPWCSLYEITDQLFDRNRLIASLIYSLDRTLSQFFAHGFTFFHEHWHQVDYLDGQYIDIVQPTTVLSGYVCGVNELGQLGLIDDQGKYHFLSSGDTSLKNINPFE